ncbi:MAG: ion channel [Acetobacteraceae bacterium]|nr:ion transporter [Pseudomonadota bacterium]
MDHQGRRQRLSEARERLRDWSLTVLLGVQLVLIFGLGPAWAFGLPVSHSFVGSIFLIVVFVVIVAAPSFWPMLVIIIALAFDATSAVLLRMPPSGPFTYWMNAIGALLSITGLSWVVISMVFSPGPMDRHRIVGAIVLYLNIALAFGVLYRLGAELSPGAFRGLPPLADVRETSGHMMYFSMATLTTVGYGDIVPVHPLVRSLSNLEALIGQLYPAIILARVMTLYHANR